MAENAFDIGIGTGVDISGLEKGLDEAQKKVLEEAAKLTQKAEKAAQDQIDIIKDTEKKKIEEIQKSIQEQIKLAKEKPGLDPATLQAEINAIKQAGSAKVKEAKTSSQLEQQIIKNSAKEKIKVIQENAKQQVEAVKNGNKLSLDSIKDFASEATSSLTGIDFSKLLVPGAVVGASIAALKKLKGALDDMAASYREQEKAEVSLRNAARNNPLLNDRAVKQLNQFANEMQRVTGLDSVMITQTQTRLASLGRSQQQIQDIIKVATDMAASGVMDFDSAVNELNNSLNGMVRTSGRLYPELKNLSTEALASGAAIELIGQKVAGSAAEAMKTGAGSVQAYQNAVESLRKSIGQDWEKATKGFREWITGVINNMVDANAKLREFLDLQEKVKKGTANAGENLRNEELKLENLNKVLAQQNALLTAGTKARRDAGYESTAQLEAEIKKTREMIAQGEALVKSLGNRLNIEDTIAAAVERTRAAAVKAGEDNLTAINALNQAIDAQKSALLLLNQGNSRGAEEFMRIAVAAAKTAEAEAARVEKNREDRQKINDLMDDYRKKLKEQTDWIIKQAELRGEDTNSLEVQKQILDTQISAYKSLIDASDGLIKNELTIEQAIKKASDAYSDRVKEEKEAEEARKRGEKEAEEAQRKADEERKKRLAELEKSQGNLLSELTKIYESAVAESDKLYNTQKEKDFQDTLTELRKKSLEDAIYFEAQYRQAQRQEERDNQLNAIKENVALQKEKLRQIRDTELEAANDNADLRLEIERKYQNDVADLDEKLIKTREQLDANFQEERRQAEAGTAEAIKQLHEKTAEDIANAYLKKWQDILSNTQKVLDAITSIADSISTIWKNSIDYQTDAKLKANNEIIQSDEERAMAEKKIMIEAAYERYKAELFNWAANVTMATANASMAVLNALNSQPFLPMGPAMAALATAMGAMQVAAVISARPKPPRFHSGGTVQGSGDIPAVLKAGEAVLTQRQFQNTMQAISNLANTKTGSAEGLVVNIHNEASDKVTATPRITPEGLEVVIEGIVNKGFEDGTFDRGIASQQTSLRGTVRI